MFISVSLSEKRPCSCQSLRSGPLQPLSKPPNRRNCLSLDRKIWWATLQLNHAGFSPPSCFTALFEMLNMHPDPQMLSNCFCCFAFFALFHTISLLSLATKDQLLAFQDNEMLHMLNKAVITRGSVSCKKKKRIQDSCLSFMLLPPTQSQQAEEIV